MDRTKAESLNAKRRKKNEISLKLVINQGHNGWSELWMLKSDDDHLIIYYFLSCFQPQWIIKRDGNGTIHLWFCFQFGKLNGFFYEKWIFLFFLFKLFSYVYVVFKISFILREKIIIFFFLFEMVEKKSPKLLYYIRRWRKKTEQKNWKC